MSWYFDADGVVWLEAAPALEGEERNGAADDEHDQGAESQKPHRECCPILVQLETHETVDEQAGAKGRGESVLGGGKVRVRSGAGRGNACIKDERYRGEGHVDVEERCDFLATWSILG